MMAFDFNLYSITRMNPKANVQFYEFLGNYFTNAARGQKQLEDMSSWIKQDFAGSDDITALFRRCYGLSAPKAGGTLDGQSWPKAMVDFQQTFTQLAEQLGWVTLTEHQQMVDKCAALEKKIELQQVTITQLRDLLYREGRGHTELFELFKGTFQEQSRQFNALLESISKGSQDKT